MSEGDLEPEEPPRARRHRLSQPAAPPRYIATLGQIYVRGLVSGLGVASASVVLLVLGGSIKWLIAYLGLAAVLSALTRTLGGKPGPD